MSIDNRWHPSLLLPPAERPILPDGQQLHPGLFLDLYRPRLIELYEADTINMADIQHHMLYTTVSAHDMLTAQHGPAEFMKRVTDETRWNTNDDGGYWNDGGQTLGELINQRNYGKYSTNEINSFNRLEVYLQYAIEDQAERFLSTDMTALYPEPDDWEEGDMLTIKLWNFICNYADQANMAQTAAFLEWATTA